MGKVSKSIFGWSGLRSNEKKKREDGQQNGGGSLPSLRKPAWALQSRPISPFFSLPSTEKEKEMRVGEEREGGATFCVVFVSVKQNKTKTSKKGYHENR